MEYAVYKMDFSTGVHLGDMNLEDREMILHADTLFSAVCQQILLAGGESKLNEFVKRVSSGEILFSDAFPYDAEHYYISKPQIPVHQSGGEAERTSDRRKEYKKMTFIPLDQIQEYLLGQIDPADVNYRIKELGRRELRTAAKVPEIGDTLPYHIGIFHFSERCGLYFILGYATEEIHRLTEEYLLGISSIGGKRSAGLGRFELKTGKLSEEAEERLKGTFSKYMTLSVCMAEEEELERVMEEAGYGLIRRGGFVDSPAYSDEFRRKNDVYLFTPGSVFNERFGGRIIDVSIHGAHPVWRYAKPIWLGVEE